MKSGKVWGQTVTVADNPFVHIERISVLPNSRCSEHEHKFRPNGFHVFRGELVIVVKKNEYDLVDRTVLRTGETHIVEPTEFHYFETGRQGCEAIEWYTPQPLSRSDIRRLDVGSRRARSATKVTKAKKRR